MARKRKVAKRRRKQKAMINVRSMAEAFMAANLVTQNVFNSNPIEFLLGDLNSSVPSNANTLAIMMGPNHNGISLKELITGSMSQSVQYTGLTQGSGTYTQVHQIGGVAGVAVENFKNNLGTILVGGAVQTAGWRVFNKITNKSVRKLNGMIKSAGLASTIQI